MVRAVEQGLPVSRPWRDSNSFDFVVGKPGRFVSVQVKSTTVKKVGGRMGWRGQGSDPRIQLV
jgi:hypothetical protein